MPTYTHIYVYIFTYMYMYTYIHAYTHIYINVCMHVCMWSFGTHTASVLWLPGAGNALDSVWWHVRLGIYCYMHRYVCTMMYVCNVCSVKGTR